MINIAVFSPHQQFFQKIHQELNDTSYAVKHANLLKVPSNIKCFRYDLIILDASLISESFQNRWKDIFISKPVILVVPQDLDLENYSYDYIYDYLFTPFSQTELNLRIQQSLNIKSLRNLKLRNKFFYYKAQKLEEKNSLLEQLVVTDSLTGAFNRRYLLERLQEEFAEAQRKPKNISLLMLDIDFFKKVNDEYGHQCGDHVLIEFTEILKKNIRPKEVVARYGGEEFAIILFDTDLASASLAAERIYHDIRNNTFYYHNRSLKITCSIGIASYPTTCSDIDLNKLVHASDAALYHAKKTGRDRICYPPNYSKHQ